ncbi:MULTISPECIES: STM2901 family protein [Caballeronia]|uniref:Mitochondrial fission process protein 1 n=1 Tax=Caballeronia jiangsuensis TaxID=1458357 RepID=A0ABW9CC55_9BURK|nr:hypothetical protein [Caballeronia sp. GaOx3]
MNYKSLIDDGELPFNRYSYGNLHDLTKEELHLCILVEVICTHFDAANVIGVFGMVLGAPMLSTRTKPGGAIAGTSLASEICRELLDVRVHRRLPTLVGFFSIRVRYVTHIGAFVGRWVPWIAVPIMAYDLVAIEMKVILRYNALVRQEDRINDATVGTLG